MLDPMPPSDADMRIARESGEVLRRIMCDGRGLRLVGQNGEAATTSVEIPAAAVPVIQAVLAAMSRGDAVSVVPVHSELTTQQAANVLGVSRPFLIGLLERGEIPFRKVGVHRRVRLQDLLSFQQRSQAAGRKALDELAAESQELGLGY